MADKVHFTMKVQELIPDNGHRDQLFDSLRRYQSSQRLPDLLQDLRHILDEPDKLELYEFIRPLILLRHQMEYSYITPPAPGVRLRTIRLHRSPNQSLGFAVRGGYEFSVGVFVSKVEPGTQAEKQGLKVGDEIVRVNGFTIAEAIHDDVLNLIKSRDEIVLKVTHIGMLPVKERASDNVTWQYVDDMDSKQALDEVLAEKQAQGDNKGVELKIFIDCTGQDSIGCGILSGPHYYPGIFVEKVRPGSLAQEVGLEVGDQIVEVNDSSFQSIGHKEAVVVLKGSKQLNVIIRKHAGFPLFDRRQTPSRRSSGTGGSSHPPGNSSPPVSQRSIELSRPTGDYGPLDEDQLIAEQLSRASLQKTTTTTTSTFRPVSDSFRHQSSTDSRMISTQAEVHSDSDSYHGSGGDGPPVHMEEPPPANLTPTPCPSPTSLSSPSSLTFTDALSLTLPSQLDDAAIKAAGVSEQLYPPPPTTTTTTTTTTLSSASTTTLNTDSDSLSLPDDLGDPVVAALRRPIYPADTPSWVVPRMYVSDLHTDVTFRGDDVVRRAEKSGHHVRSLGEKRAEGKGEGKQDAKALVGDGLVRRSGRMSQVAHSRGVFLMEGGKVGDERDSEKVQSEKDGEVNTAEGAAQSDVIAPQVDENSNTVKVGAWGLWSDSETVSAGQGEGEKVEDSKILVEESDPLGFVPPPPPLPLSPPSPTTISSVTEDYTVKSVTTPSTPSGLSSLTTQTLKPQEGDAQFEDGFVAVIEFDSESEESSHSGREREAEGINYETEFNRRGKGDAYAAESFTEIDASSTGFSLAETEMDSQLHADTAGYKKDLPGLSLASGFRPEREGDEVDVGGEDAMRVDGVGMAASAEKSRQKIRPGSEVMKHHLPPLSLSSLSEESGEDNNTFPASTPAYPHPSPPPPPPPPVPSSSSSFSSSLVLGGAAAVLAARREAQEQERSPRLLGPAEPGPSGRALGGVSSHCPHDLLATLFNPLELDGRELKAFSFPKGQSLGVAMEGGLGTPLAGRIVVAAVFGSGAAVEHGLQTGDQLMMLNGQKLTDISVAEAEQILERAYGGPKDMIEVVYAQSSFLNDEECVTYF